MKKFLSLLLACTLCGTALAKGPGFFLNGKPVDGSRYFVCPQRLDSLKVDSETGKILMWSSKVPVEYLSLEELLRDNDEVGGLHLPIYYQIDDTVTDKPGELMIDRMYKSVSTEITTIPRADYIKPEYRGRTLVKIRLHQLE